MAIPGLYRTLESVAQQVFADALIRGLLDAGVEPYRYAGSPDLPSVGERIEIRPERHHKGRDLVILSHRRDGRTYLLGRAPA